MNTGNNVAVNTGPDIYVSGWDGYSAVYWKNGNEVFLDHGVEATSIAVSGSNVYTAGFIQGGFIDSVIGGYYNIASYWKNDSLVVLTDGTGNALANSIFVSGNDVYVAGYETRNQNIPEYWKNGNRVILSNDGGEDATSIFVTSGNATTGNVYVAGDFANYWINGTQGLLDGISPVDTVWSSALSIFVSGSDVYAAGFHFDGTQTTAKYWKNGVPVILSGNAPGKPHPFLF